MTQLECTCAALRQASRFVTRLYDEALAPVGLGINQYSILARLERLGPLVLQDLARNLVMDRSTLGHLLRPLEKRGFVAIQPSPDDARCRLITLTADGRAGLAAAQPLWSAAQRQFEARFGASQAAKLRTALLEVVGLPVEPSWATPTASGSSPLPPRTPA